MIATLEYFSSEEDIEKYLLKLYRSNQKSKVIKVFKELFQVNF